MGVVADCLRTLIVWCKKIVNALNESSVRCRWLHLDKRVGEALEGRSLFSPPVEKAEELTLRIVPCDLACGDGVGPGAVHFTFKKWVALPDVEPRCTPHQPALAR